LRKRPLISRSLLIVATPYVRRKKSERGRERGKEGEREEKRERLHAHDMENFYRSEKEEGGGGGGGEKARKSDPPPVGERGAFSAPLLP